MPKFVVKMPGKGETSFHADEDDIFIGRVPTINDICIGDLSVSRQHVHVKLREEGYTIYDLKSLNGVFLNGTRVSRAVLKHGDIVRLGDVEMRVEFEPVSQEEEMRAIEQSETTNVSHELDGSPDEPTRRSNVFQKGDKPRAGGAGSKKKKR